MMALLVDGLSLLLRRQVWLDRSAALLWGAGALSAGAAFLTGRRAAESVGMVAPEVELALVRHADAALWALVAGAMLAALRIALARAARRDPTIQRLKLRAPLLLLAVGVGALVGITADRGGALVYQHGVAVASSSPEFADGSADEPGSTPGTADPRTAGPDSATTPKPTPLAALDHGGLEWMPLATDGPYLRQVLQVVTDPAGAISTEPAPATGQDPRTEGLPLTVNGRAFLLLPGDFGDLQAEALLDLANFTGTAAVVHHYRTPAAFDAFEFVGQSSALTRHVDGTTEVLDQAEAASGSNPIALAVSSAGSHLKGYLDGQTVVHGHASALPPGRAGLLLEGTGHVRLHRLRVEPVPQP